MESLLPFVVATLLVCIAPGPDNIFVLTQSALYGNRSGILVVLGLCTGLVLHTTVIALGVAALFTSSKLAFTLLTYAGAAYLLYLAWQAFRSQPATLSGTANRPVSSGALYLRGIVMNASNPKVLIFFLAFLPQFVRPDHPAMAQQLFLLGGIVIAVTFISFSAISVLAGTVSRFLRDSPKGQLVLNRIAGGVFVVLAVNLVLVNGI